MRDDDDTVDEPVGASVRRVLAQSPWWSRGPLVPSVASGWLAYYFITRRSALDDWRIALAILAGVVVASWIGIVGVLSRSPNRVRRHSAHYVGVTMLGVAICATLGGVAGLLAQAFRRQ